jgi:transposase
MAFHHLAEGKKGGFRNRVIFGFFDESGFADRPHVVRTWSIKGQTPLIRSKGGWKRVTAAGMITFSIKTKRAASLAWLSKRGMRKERVCSILDDLKRRYKKKRLLLLWDGLPAHKAKLVERYIKENKDWLTVYRFPAYAPELNPQEYVWSAVKRKDMGNYCPSTFGALRGRVYRVLAKRKRASSFLKGCLKASGLFSVKELGEG